MLFFVFFLLVFFGVFFFVGFFPPPPLFPSTFAESLDDYFLHVCPSGTELLKCSSWQFNRLVLAGHEKAISALFRIHELGDARFAVWLEARDCCGIRTCDLFEFVHRLISAWTVGEEKHRWSKPIHTTYFSSFIGNIRCVKVRELGQGGVPDRQFQGVCTLPCGRSGFHSVFLQQIATLIPRLGSQ